MVGRPKLNEPTTQKQKPEPLTMCKHHASADGLARCLHETVSRLSRKK